MKGIIVYSFALRDREPNPCNVRLARATKRIKEEFEEQGETVLIVAQKTVAFALRGLEVPVDYTVVRYKYPGRTDSEDITTQAADFFRSVSPADDPVDEVIPVAHPIQEIKCRQEVRKAGFKTLSLLKLWRKIGRVGTDRESKQWWTRGPIRLITGAAIQVLFGYNTRQHGPSELSE